MMGNKFADITFTTAVKKLQTEKGSRKAYAKMEQQDVSNQRLGEQEKVFISTRDSFYIASVSETAWPYIQHRGGPSGFIHVLDEQTIGFADYSGNRQYITSGNLMKNPRVALFFMDYPNRRRLKLLGKAQIIPQAQSERVAELAPSHYRARVESGFIIRVEAFDWNCPQHITPRYTDTEVNALTATLEEENQELKNKLKLLASRGKLN